MACAVGLITEARQAEDILQDGQADLIALARELMHAPTGPCMRQRNWDMPVTSIYFRPRIRGVEAGEAIRALGGEGFGLAHARIRRVSMKQPCVYIVRRLYRERLMSSRIWNIKMRVEAASYKVHVMRPMDDGIRTRERHEVEAEWKLNDRKTNLDGNLYDLFNEFLILAFAECEIT